MISAQARFGVLVPVLGLMSVGLVLVSPMAGLAAAGGFFAIGLLSYGERLHRGFLLLLACLLVGYALFSRGFAYIGFAPLYLGEMTLALGMLCVLVYLHRLQLGTIEVLLLAFMALGVLRTLPYLGVYGMDALRDAVLWGYAPFALAVVVALSYTGALDKVPAVYGRVLPLMLLATPLIGAAATLTTGVLLPIPGTNVGLLSYKGGDAAVHLAGAAAFLALGFYPERGKLRVPIGVLWLLWFVGFAVAGISRAGMITAGLGAVVAFLFHPTQRLAQIFIVAAVVVLIAAALNIQVDLGRPSGRSISAEQFVSGVESIVGQGDGEGGRIGTREYRLQWWGEIWDYTVQGPYFWSGKGFGINLADSDGFQVLEDASLRAPHNSHITVLARMGVPGLMIWIALQLVFGVKLISVRRQANALGLRGWAAMDAWIFIYWLAMLVNTSFDPYLEGPQGGIWFWSVFGLGIYCIRRQEGLIRAARASQQAPQANVPGVAPALPSA